MKKAKKNVPRRATPIPTDKLISQLENVEQALQRWMKTSPENSGLFRRDPIGAMRKAGLDIDDDIMLEIETITTSIAKRLK